MEKNTAGIVRAQFNETIEKWIVYLDGYTLEMLCTKPQPGRWSLGQVYVHIITDTPWFIHQAKACMLTNANSEKKMHNNAKTMFANNALPNIIIKGPPTNNNVRQPHSKEELLMGLTLIKDEANKLFLTPDFSASAGKTKHPGLGWFNAIEWLQFAEMHARHHLGQKKRIDEKILQA